MGNSCSIRVHAALASSPRPTIPPVYQTAAPIRRTGPRCPITTGASMVLAVVGQACGPVADSLSVDGALAGSGGRRGGDCRAGFPVPFSAGGSCPLARWVLVGGCGPVLMSAWSGGLPQGLLVIGPAETAPRGSAPCRGWPGAGRGADRSGQPSMPSTTPGTGMVGTSSAGEEGLSGAGIDLSAGGF